MSGKPRLSVCLGAWNPTYDRFLKAGYRDPIPFENVLADIASISGVTAIEMSYPGTINEDNFDQIMNTLEKYGLSLSCIASSISGNRKWIKGSFTNPDAKIRCEAIENTKRTMAMAKSVGAIARQWFGQDGFDYHFTGDPRSAWEYLVEGLRECGEAHPDVKLAIEYKNREPKRWSYVSSAAVALLLAEEAQCENIGICLDLGHAKLAGETYANTITLTHRHNRFFHVHLNENYGITDDDMAIGSVHLMELIELVYWLKTIEYSGWFSSDVWPAVDDPKGCNEQSLGFFTDLWNLVDKVGLENLQGCIEKRSYPDAMAEIRKRLFNA